MPRSTDPSRDLLFGLLALQTGMIDQGALFTAFAAWTRDKGRPLADHLIALGRMDTARRAAVEAIAGVHLQTHGGDIEKSLAAVPAGRSTRASLVEAGGPEVEATMGHVGTAHPATRADDDDPERTATVGLGSATSEGQRFRILRPYARGGLGAVFVALDGELNREVALKQILERHADDTISRQRFVAEAEITGSLEHPGIVPVYGVGTDSSGRPYYAMRFIKGDSLKEAIARFHEDETLRADPGRRSIDQRTLLRRFTDVCNAVDYAHSRGVIHRDLKPANVIVGKHGETLVVDWGLAKAVGRADPSVGEQTLAPSSSGSSETLPGSALGTPSYMSPEQSRGELDRLGPRSDVYSLGATLYCLLTGKPPFEGDDVGATLRAVQEGRFRRPSLVDHSLDRALEAICLKAMATHPEDRYATPRALADDLERWMADEPVTAWREPFSRRARRWARRNRTAVTAAAVTLVAGVVGLSAVLAVQTQANADIARSLASETRANAALAQSNQELTRSQAAVQARYELAVEAIKTFHTGVSEDFLLKEEQFKAVRDRLLKSASDFYGKLGALLGKESDVASRRALWQANFEVAELTGKVGKPEDALAAHRQVLAAREVLGSESPADPELKAEVGRSLRAVASLLQDIGKTREAEETYRKAEALLVELPRTIAETDAVRAARAYCREGLGWLLYKASRYDEALSVFLLARADQEVLVALPKATLESRRDLAATIYKLARVLEDKSKSTEAEAEYRKSQAIQQKLADDNPSLTEVRSALATSHETLGWLLWTKGRGSEAETEYRKGLAIAQRLVIDDPAVTEFRTLKAEIHGDVGNLLHGLGRFVDAEAEFRRELALRQKLADDNPSVPEYRRRLANCLENLEELLGRAGKSMEALQCSDRALALHEQLVKEHPDSLKYRVQYAESFEGRGQEFLHSGDIAAAAAAWRRGIALYEGLDSIMVSERCFYRAGTSAGLSGLAGRPGSGVSVLEGREFADDAMNWLRRAVALGERNSDRFQHEPTLDPLRNRADFQELIMDLAFPTEPFAP